ncbi:MAG: tandem-95 repeat protein [Anaerolineae bacterium]|nr:tandem-95 repeat protein [Anaerolineae bacterium]
MQANKNFTKTSRTLGLSLRILMVLTMLLSSIAAQFTPVSAAASEDNQVETRLALNDRTSEDEGGEGETQGDPAEEPAEEPGGEVVEEPTEEPTDVPVEEPTEEPMAEPTEIPAETPTSEPSAAPLCYALTLSHEGQGSDPIAEPANSLGCEAGFYLAGELISLNGALPDEGWEVIAWSGTDDDASKQVTNTLLMPAEDHAVAVVYRESMLIALTEEEDEEEDGEVSAQTTYNWVAYNDCAWVSGQTETNITKYTITSGSTTGLLKNYATGDNSTVTVTISSYNSPTVVTGSYGGAETNSGTDAYTTFHDYANMAGVIQYGSTGWYVDVTLTGLDISKTYTFATSANRASSSYTRNSKFTLSDVTDATNASTSGVTVNSNLSVSFNTGYNTVNGYVARWTNIQPGSDGDFVVRIEADSSYQAYGPSVFMLAEEVGTTPTITTSGSLTAFNTAVGIPSAEQNYTVAGSNLSDAIVITAPDDFEVSTTSGSGFGASVSLSPSDGTVASTPVYVRYNPAEAGTASGNITHVSTDATTQNVAVSGSSVPVITVTSAMTAFSSAVGVASAEQSYSVSALNLTDNLLITAPANFEIAAASGGPFGTSLSLTPVSGVVTSTPVYVRFNAAAAGTYNDSITHASTGATTATAAISGTAGNPTISVTGTLTEFNSTAGTASDEQSYSVAGNFLTSDIIITAPTNFYLSTTSGSGFDSSLTLTPVNGTIATTTIYVYFLKSSVGTSSGNITHSSIGATQVDQPVSGNATPAPTCFTANLAVSADTWMRSSQATMNYGASDTVQISPYSSNPQGSLYRWDLSSIPSNATVDSASLTFYVTEGSAYAFSLYHLRRAWEEGTGTSSGTAGVGASWTYYGAGTGNWGTAGAANTSSDRYNTNLWNAAASAFNSTGIQEFELNSSGIDVVQGWVDGSLSNYGLTMQNYSGASTNDYWIVASRQNTSGYSVPTLNIDYCIPVTGPTITTSGSLGAFSAEPGSPSAAQTYTVSGSNLTNDISINAPADFEISSDGVNYGSSLTLTQSDGVVEETTIHARLASHAGEGTFSGNIAHTSEGATTQNVAVSGSVLYTYTLIVGNDGNGSVTLSPAGGSYSNGTVVTLTPVPNSGFAFDSWSGANAGDVINTGGVYTIVVNGDKSLDATFTASQVCTTVNLEAVDDLYMSGANTSNNYGTSTALRTTLSSSSPRGTLYRWDLSTIPSNATVSSASIKVYVSTAASATFSLYAMRRDWLEGTGAGSATGDGATWLTYDGTNTWGTNGAANTSTDRYDTNLWGAGSSSFSSTGYKTIDLNESGIGVVQNWIDGSLANYGLTLQNYGSSSTAYDLQIASAENTSYTGATLNITYCIPGGVTYTLNISNDGNGSVTLDPAGGSYANGTTVTLTPVPNSGYEFSTWTGTNASDPEDNGDGTWSLVMDGNKAITANFTLLPVNVAPNMPVLVKPLDDATSVVLSPTLEVTVSDANPADTLDVEFYGREVGGSSGEDFTLIVIPDTQNYSTSYPQVFNSQMEWIADQKAEDNIVFATHVGDIVNTASSTTEWTRADTAMGYLDSGNVAYSVGPGNHDLGGLYSTYFGTSRFSGKSTYGGSYDTSNYNNYSLFSASGMDFILINLQYGTSSSSGQLTWADTLLKTYSSRRGIVVQHDILNINNSWYNQASYTALRDNPNLFLMLCGHMHSSTDGAAYVAGTGEDGHTIHVMLADYQDYTASGYLRILRFSPADDKIYATTYSPYTGNSLTSTTNYDQMEMAYDMVNGNSAFELLGSVNDVVNGQNASITWGGLTNSTEYEWYAIVSDGTETVTGSTWSFTTEASGTNHAPVLNSIADQEVDELDLLSFTATASDSDLDTLYYSLAAGSGGSVPSGAAIGSTSGIFSWTPTEAQGAGYYTFDVCVSDGSLSDCQTIHVTVNEVDNAPVLAAIGNKVIDELVTLAFTASATDSDDDPITYSLENGTGGTVPSGASIHSTSGAFSWTPTEAQGAGVFTFDVCASANSQNDCETITVTVNEVNVAPVLAELENKSGNELSTLTFTAIGTDGDLPTNTLTYNLTGAVPSGASIGSSSGFFSWIPAEAQGPGSYTFDVCVSDSSLTDCQTITLTIYEVNLYPVLEAIGSQSGDELTEITFTAQASDADLPANALTYYLSSGGGSVPSGAAIGSTSGVFSWTPSEAQGSGLYTFDVCVNDGSADDCETINVTVNEVNTAPDLAEIANKSVIEEQLLTFTATASDSDLPENALTYSLTGTIPAGASIGSSSGIFTWTPDDTQGGSDYTFSIRVCDDGSPSLCDEQAITVTVTESNVAPVAFDDNYETNEDTQLVVAAAPGVLANDEDANDDELTAIKMSDPQHGSLTLNEDGSFTYTPAENYFGSDSFTYKANDGFLDSNTATVSLIIHSVNDLPTANAQSVSTEEDTAKAITLSGSDVESSPLSYFVVDDPQHGELSGAAPNLIYTPDDNYFGADSFTFKVNDGSDDSSPATVSITVDAVNDEPAITEGSSASVSMSKNGIPTAFELILHASDADTSDTLTWSIGTQAEHGEASVSGIGTNKTIHYSPDTDYTGSDSFIVTVSDGHDGTDSITVHVTISEVLLTISGNAGADGVTLTYTGGSTTSGTSGDYTFEVSYGWSGTVTPSLSGYIFTPASRSYSNLTADASSEDYLATPYGTQEIDLNEGWNLVSFRVHPTSTDIEDVLASIEGNYSLVYAWDASEPENSWLKYDPSAEPFANSLTDLDESMGFWIEMATADTLSISGTLPSATNIPLLTAAGGWNLAGYPSTTNGPLPETLSAHGVGTAFSLVYTYNNADAGDPWKMYDLTGSSYANDLADLTSGHGYWIHVSSDATWNVVH